MSLKHWPYEPWVVEGWIKLSEAVNGPEIAKCFRYNLTTRITSGMVATIDKDGIFTLITDAEHAKKEKKSLKSYAKMQKMRDKDFWFNVWKKQQVNKKTI
jgi:hypothetical protein